MQILIQKLQGGLPSGFGGEVRQAFQIRGQEGIFEVKRHANECDTQQLLFGNPQLECLGRGLEEESEISALHKMSL